MIAFVFPGQGSQRKGMGHELFEEVSEFYNAESAIDEIMGCSLRDICLHNVSERLRDTRYTQSCLYMVNALYYYKSIGEGRRASYLAGHSLGEYNALLAAGVFDFLTGLKLVKRRGELMSEVKNGGMGAVIGLGAAVIAKVIEDNGLGIDVANFNSPEQTVVSGPIDEIERAGALFDTAGARAYVRLPVSAAFHSRNMAKVAKVFADYLAPMTFAAPNVPVIANATAQPYPTDDASDSIKALLTRQIESPVQWRQSIRSLLGRGVSEFVELGPGHVLTSLVQQVVDEKTPMGSAVPRNARERM